MFNRNFDALERFYLIQQACMDDDKTKLSEYCTKGMAMALAGNPEPGRVATKTLTGVTYTINNDFTYVTYTFKDGGELVKENWAFTSAGLFGGENKLEGIEVL